jgi:hypothetical protein
MFKLIKLAATAVVFFSGAVSATTTTFDFRSIQGSGIRNFDDSLTFTSGVLDVTVQGFTLSGSDANLPFGTATDESKFVTTTNNGIIFDRVGDTDLVDGRGDNEFILFSFSQAVSFNSINFDLGSGSFQFFRDVAPAFDGGLGAIDVFGAPTAIPGGLQIFNFGSTVSGVSNTFGIAAIADTDAFAIRNINVTAAVPEPATWLLMILGFGLVGLTLQRRRRLANA